MMLLAVDTSTRAIGVALYDGVRVLSEHTWISKNHHTIELAPTVESALTQIGADANDVKAVGVAIGPGGFTGLRIGLALAKGLALSKRIPLVGIRTLDIVAYNQIVSTAYPLAAVLEAGRRRLAVGWYTAEEGCWAADGELENLTLEEFATRVTAPTLVSGELSAEVRYRLAETPAVLASPVACVRRPGALAALAWTRWENQDTDDPASLKPIYLHHGEPIPG